MTRKEAKNYLKEEILLVINEEFSLNEASDNDYEDIAQELEALAERADEMGDATLAKQIRNQVSYANKEAVKLAGEGGGAGDMDMDMDMDMGDDLGLDDEAEIEDVEIEDTEEESKDDKKKKKVKEALRQEILKTLR